MELRDILLQNPDLTLEGFQKLQSEYDDRFIANDFSGFGKVRHTYAHMGKLMGRLAEYVHDMEEEGKASDEEIRKKVIPDLLVYSAWLAKEFDVNIADAYLTRFVGNIKRLHSEKITSDELTELERIVAKMTQKKISS
jgi:hypothetical protein